MITDFAQKPDEIDVEHAERAKVRAEERIREKKSQIEFAHSQAELARAMAKLKVARKSGSSLGRWRVRRNKNEKPAKNCSVS